MDEVSKENGVLISVIVPVYNRANLIAETISSIQQQSCSDWELVVVDDHSTDDTCQVVEIISKDDDRVRLYRRPDDMPKGANSCRNFGLLQTRGEFIKWMDSDDLLVSDCLERQADVLKDNTNIKVCLGYGQYFRDSIDNLGEMWSRNFESVSFFSDHIINKIRWPIGGLLWRKSWFKFPPFSNSLKNSQEWLMHSLSLLLLADSEIYNDRQICYYIRMGHLRMSSSRSSVYYQNQAKARIILLKVLFNQIEFRIGDCYQLTKQVIVYLFYALISFRRN